MALGDSNKTYSPSYFSRLKFSNTESNLNLSFSFSGGLLILKISKKKENGDFEDLEEIKITPTKAKIIKDSVDAMLRGEINGEAVGVTSGLKEIVNVIFFNYDDQSSEFVSVTIGKVNPSGEFTQQHTFEFNHKGYHYALVWSDVKGNVADKHYNDKLEFEMLMDLFESFSKSMNGSAGYAALDLNRYDYNRLMNRMKPIYDKMGIEWPTSSSNQNTGNNFYNNNTRNQGGSAEHKDFDAAMDELPFN